MECRRGRDYCRNAVASLARAVVGGNRRRGSEGEGAERTAMNQNREELLFQLALTKPADERAAWLERECADDKALCARVAALLAAHDQPDELLAAPDEGAAPTLKIEFAEDPADEVIGQKIGR